jgi:DNA modification methylase
MVAEQLGRNWILIDAQPENEKLMRERTAQSGLMLAMDAA